MGKGVGCKVRRKDTGNKHQNGIQITTVYYNTRMTTGTQQIN